MNDYIKRRIFCTSILVIIILLTKTFEDSIYRNIIEYSCVIGIWLINCFWIFGLIFKILSLLGMVLEKIITYFYKL